MYIKRVTDEQITFSDRSYIVFDHIADCCEWNYADFSILEIMANTKFFSKVDIEPTENGFLLILDREKIYIPCYSVQNGYYRTDLDVFYYDCHNELIKEINIEAEEFCYC